MNIDQYMLKSSPGMPAKTVRKDKEKEKPKPQEEKMAAAGNKTPTCALDESTVQAITDAVTAAIAGKLDNIAVQIADIKTSLEDITPRIDAAEGRIASLETGAMEANTQYQKLEKLLEAQEAKIEDLENRSRRCNLRFAGFSEAVEEYKLAEIITAWLPAALGLSEQLSTMVIERAHRLGARRDSDTRPRIVIVKILNFQHKHLIWQTSRTNRELKYNNTPIKIFQDFSYKVAMKRKEFVPVCTSLATKQIKFALQFPARLRVWHAGTMKIFDSASAAKQYVEQIAHNGAS